MSPPGHGILWCGFPASNIMSTFRNNKLTDLGEKSTTLDGKQVSYVLKRSPRARAIRFQIVPGTGLVVVIPHRCRPEDILPVMRAHTRWILDKLAKFGAPREPVNKELASGDSIPYLGGALPLQITKNDGRETVFQLGAQSLVVSLGQANPPLGAMLEHWYRLQAARVIQTTLDQWSARMGLRHNRLFIRGQRTRWGSCSKKGNLGFNWKLVLAPQPVIEYVVIHELAHLQEMNHGKRFWALVEHHCPGWKAHKKWLRDHGNLADKPFLG